METFKISYLAVQFPCPPKVRKIPNINFRGVLFLPVCLKLSWTKHILNGSVNGNLTGTCHNELPRKANGEEKKEQFQQAKSEVWCNCAGILNGVGLLGPNSPCQDMRHGQWRPPGCWGKGLRFGHMSSCWTRWNGCTDSWICSCLSVQAQDAANNSYLIDKRLLHFLVVGLGT